MIIVHHLRNVGYRPKGIVHVGAHFGQEREGYKSLNPELIVWVEADPETFAGLQRAVTPEEREATPRQILLNALISDKDGDIVPFHRFSNYGVSSSMFSATPLLTEAWPDVKETGEIIELTSRRIDSLFPEQGIFPQNVDVMIFDVQGAELMALQGSGKYLENTQFVEVEVSKQSIYEGAPLEPEVSDFLRNAGFERITTDIPWHGDVVYGRHGAQGSSGQ